jgi:hypothetical protein
MAAGDGERLLLGHGSEPEVAVFRTDGNSLNLVRIVRFTVPDRAVSAADVATERRRVVAEYFELQEHEEEIPAAGEVPAFVGLRAGRDGRVWVREYLRDLDREQQSWLSFSPEGHFECRLEVPAFRQIFEIGADYMLVLHVDELDIERVQRYELVRMGPATGTALSSTAGS